MSDSMSIIFIVLVLIGVTALIVSLFWYERRKRQFILDIAAQWAQEGRNVYFSPVLAMYYGDEPLRSHRGIAGTNGALGIADESLIFVSLSGRHEHRIFFDLIRWVGVHAITVTNGESTIEKSALVVHYEAMGKWYMAAWTMDWPHSAAAALGQQTGLPVRDKREDYGPAKAVCLLQDVYGEWHPAAEIRYRSDLPVTPFAAVLNSDGSLYLAPDRLLLNRRYALHLSQVRCLDVYESGGLLHDLNPFAEDLLRIEYEMPDDAQRHVVGFQVQHAEKWGTLLAQRTQVPFDVREGRKKKA